MCTVVLLVRPDHPIPVMLAANRDERLDRPWDPPAAWWPEKPGVIGGRDRGGGGTWLALNGTGLLAAVLNRPGSLGPAPGKRSRGELPLIAAEQPILAEAVAAIIKLDGGAWRSFNMVLCDPSGACFVRGVGYGHPQAEPIEPGISMVTAHDPNDSDSPRTARHLPRFRQATPPDRDDWAAWRAILSDRSGGPGEEINVPPRAGFGTVCSSLIALPRRGKPHWLFAAGPPDAATFEAVTV